MKLLNYQDLGRFRKVPIFDMYYCFISFTCDGVCQVLISSLPQQTHQTWNPITVLDGYFVVVVTAVRDVLQGSTGRMVNVLLGVVQHGHQSGDSLQSPHLRFHLHKDVRM